MKKIFLTVALILVTGILMMSFVNSKNAGNQIETITLRKNGSGIQVFYPNGTQKDIIVEGNDNLVQINKVLNELGKEGYKIEGMNGEPSNYVLFLQRVKQ